MVPKQEFSALLIKYHNKLIISLTVWIRENLLDQLGFLYS